MLLALLISVFLISRDLGLGFTNIIPFIVESEYSKIFFWEGEQLFLKRFFTGAFIAIVMTGLDQDMMQKNLSCKNIGEAQKNMLYFSISLIFVNLMFLCLGALLYTVAGKHGIIFSKPDDLFPAVVLSETLGFPLILSLIHI